MKRLVNVKNMEGVGGGGNEKGSIREGAAEQSEAEGVDVCHTRLP